MTASVAKESSGWIITLANTASARSWSFTMAVAYSRPGASAERIMEAPSSAAGWPPWSATRPFPFDPGTVNGVSPGLVASEGGELIQGGVVASSPSAPDHDADGFASAYGSVAPPARAS